MMSARLPSSAPSASSSTKGLAKNRHAPLPKLRLRPHHSHRDARRRDRRALTYERILAAFSRAYRFSAYCVHRTRDVDSHRVTVARARDWRRFGASGRRRRACDEAVNDAARARELDQNTPIANRRSSRHVAKASARRDGVNAGRRRWRGALRRALGD